MNGYCKATARQFRGEPLRSFTANMNNYIAQTPTERYRGFYKRGIKNCLDRYDWILQNLVEVDGSEDGL
jgi:hypothetical protein